MSQTLQSSPMLDAIDLMRVNIDAMLFDDLETHAQRVLDTMAAVNGYVNSPNRKSVNLLFDALRLVKKLGWHMARVRDLIAAHQAAAALAGQAGAVAGSAGANVSAQPAPPAGP